MPAHRPFLEDLAAGVLAWLGDLPPETLSDATILLPNRRAARAFTGALSKLSQGRPILLPQVRPLGDLEEDEPPFTPGALGLDLPPAIPALTRRFEMARMIVEQFDRDLTPMRALDLADALGGFLDSCQLEEVQNPERIATLVDGEMAEHWERSAEFLGLAVTAWPKRLAELGLVDPAWRRATLLRRLAELWDHTPPIQAVIAAGSTGTVPAAGDVLKAVAKAPLGCVVLPGLDLDLDAQVWDRLDEQHPQSAMKRLLDRCDIPRDAVRPWFRPPASPAVEARGLARQRLVNEALRPAEATDDWRRAIRDIRSTAAARGEARDPIAEGLQGLSLLSVRAEEEAAAAIALMMRETLETPNPDGTGKTCALVTPDQALGRRVAARLERWGVIPDSSAGAPLSRLPAGALVDLCARWIADPVQPHLLLAVAKHPLARFDLGDAAQAAAVAALEEHALRGPRPRDFAAVRRRLLEAVQPDRRGKAPPEWKRDRLSAATRLVDHLQTGVEAATAVFTPHPEGNGADLNTAASALTRLIETLAGQDAWAGPDGEAAAALLSGLIEGGASLGRIDRTELAELTTALVQETVVRTGGATHPSLRILGAIEARLVRADRMILAGLEEGVWPQAAPTDPFLSRPMRKALGLPPPERRQGQTAQDFVQAACADEVILVHSERRGGQPAVRSRWLWRLEMLTRGADAAETPVSIARPTTVLDWARALDAPPPGPPRFAKRPEPRPPVHRRPRSLYVTRIERWVRDPYAIYALWVLGLEAMERPGASAEALARGNAVHAAIERLTLDWPDDLPDDCETILHDHLLRELGARGFEDAAMAREAPLARNCARWLTDFERRRRARGVEILVEQQGAMTFDGPAGPFTVKAFADRIELASDGAAVMDFKTGAAPSAKQVKSGFAPQLTLTAAILADGGFERTNGPVTPDELTYVRVVGRKTAGEVITRASGAEAADLTQAALDGLKRRVARFDDPNTPYVSWAAPQFMGNQGGNYDHLARVWEWSVIGDGEDSE
ncbi:MAG: double-strand break repair protein AddB [Brevundimonas sp.]|nr:double-strand break repair protein AddB [Brevundimonas sp.]